jgi:hypothetical protein
MKSGGNTLDADRSVGKTVGQKGLDGSPKLMRRVERTAGQMDRVSQERLETLQLRAAERECRIDEGRRGRRQTWIRNRQVR